MNINTVRVARVWLGHRPPASSHKPGAWLIHRCQRVAPLLHFVRLDWWAGLWRVHLPATRPAARRVRRCQVFLRDSAHCLRIVLICIPILIAIQTSSSREYRALWWVKCTTCTAGGRRWYSVSTMGRAHFRSSGPLGLWMWGTNTVLVELLYWW